MANNVQNYIIIKNINKDVIAEIERIFSVKDDMGDTHTLNLINSIFGLNWEEKDYDRTWVIDNIGAKWVYGQIVSEYDSSVELSLTSAWDPINELLTRLSSNLFNIKDDVIIENKFEDESLDPIGVAYFSKEYNDIEYLDDEVDINKFWEDDDYRYEIYEIVEGMMEDERRIHLEVIEDLKLNKK